MTTPSPNIAYVTPAIEAFYRDHRVRWDQFYQSERAILEELGLTAVSSVLDIGCGCGGLGLALRERFGVVNYTGVEINRQAAETAREMNPSGSFIWKDILNVLPDELLQESFDVVVSLSCIDWNVRFTDMLAHAYRYVKPGGCLVASLRLTPSESLIDSRRSYQYINFDGKREGEIAPYVVLNFRDFMSYVATLAPARIRAVGYWGTPSPTAVTTLNRVVFCAVAVWKRLGAGHEQVRQLDLPLDLMLGASD
jgi:SAM-dependent methyltransferase